MLAQSFSACSSATTATDAEVLGHLTLPLETTSDGTQYRLEHATFVIDGPMHQLELSSDNGDAELTTELPPGDYRVALQPGWELNEISDDVAQPIAARLSSPSTLDFAIDSESATRVVFTFTVQDQETKMSDGQLVLAFDVLKQARRQLVISEIMNNPAAVADAEGEWFELSNVGSEPVELEGCIIHKNESEHAIATELELPPGGALALANGEQPGFTPGYVYNGFPLPNSGVFDIGISCSGELLDEVTIDTQTFPKKAGASMSLSGDALSATANDSASAWCLAVESYSADRGTPGELNPVCP